MQQVVLVAALVGAPADDGGGVELRWDAPPECPDAGAVQERTRELSRAAGVDDKGADLRAYGSVRATATGYSLDLRLEGSHDAGDRHLEATDRAELAHAAALILTIAIDPSAAWKPDGEVVPEPATAAVEVADPRVVARTEEPPQPVAIPPAQTSLAGDRAGAPRLGFGVRAGLGIDALLWRPVGASTLLAVALLGRGYRIELIGRYATPSTVSTASNPSLRARAQQWSLGASGCGVPTFAGDRLELLLCAGVEAGAMHARGVGDSIASKHTRGAWIAMSAGPTLLWRVGERLGLWIGADGVVLVGRPHFVTDSGTEVLDPRRAGLRALAGLEFRPTRRSR